MRTSEIFLVEGSGCPQVCASCEAAVAAAERDAAVALEALAVSVTGATLERMRRLKGRIGRLVARCDGVRDELLRFLDDDRLSSSASNTLRFTLFSYPKYCKCPPSVVQQHARHVPHPKGGGG